MVLRLTAAWAAVGKLEKHLLSFCCTELQSRFTGRPIRQVLTLPPTLLSTSVWISLLLCMQAVSSLSIHSKPPSFLVSSYIGIITNIWSKFLCWDDSAKVLRELVWAICTAWFCCVCSCNWALAACWTVNNYMTDLFMSVMLWSSVEPLCHMNDCLGGPWDPKSLGRPEEPPLGGWVDQGDLCQGVQGTAGPGEPPPGGPEGPGGPPPRKPGVLENLHQGS